MKITRFVMPVLLACTLSGAAWSQSRELSDQGELLDRVVAVVNDGIVLQSELNSQLAGVMAALRQQEQSLPSIDLIRQQVLESLVVRKIQLQLAQMTGIIVSDEMLNSYLQRVAARADIPFSELPAALEADGVDYVEYREHSREEIAIDILKQRDVSRRIRISKKEVDAYLRDLENDEKVKSEYDLSHILIAVPPTSSPQVQQQAQDRAEDIYLRLQAGENFCELAVAYSDGQQALECGNLGWRVGNGLPGFLGDVVFGMDVGEISDPIHNPSGYHIIRLNGIRGGEEKSSIVTQNQVRHILIETNDIIDDQTAETQLQRILEDIEAGADFAAIAQSVSKDTISAKNGGDLGWQKVGTFVPEFEEQIVNTPVGEVSEPFKSPFGWHILEVMGTREYDNTDEEKEQVAMRQLRSAKLQEETEIWIQRIREDAFVEYRL